MFLHANVGGLPSTKHNGKGFLEVWRQKSMLDEVSCHVMSWLNFTDLNYNTYWLWDILAVDQSVLTVSMFNEIEIGRSKGQILIWVNVSSKTVRLLSVLVNGEHLVWTQKQNAYHVNMTKREMMQEEASYLLEHGRAKPSCSSWSSPCVIIPKSNGTPWFCTFDFHTVNVVRVSDSFPLPHIEDCVAKLFFSGMITKEWTILFTVSPVSSTPSKRNILGIGIWYLLSSHFCKVFYIHIGVLLNEQHVNIFQIDDLWFCKLALTWNVLSFHILDISQTLFTQYDYPTGHRENYKNTCRSVNTGFSLKFIENRFYLKAGTWNKCLSAVAINQYRLLYQCLSADFNLFCYPPITIVQ